MESHKWVTETDLYLQRKTLATVLRTDCRGKKVSAGRSRQVITTIQVKDNTSFTRMEPVVEVGDRLILLYFEGRGSQIFWHIGCNVTKKDDYGKFKTLNHTRIMELSLCKMEKMEDETGCQGWLEI